MKSIINIWSEKSALAARKSLLPNIHPGYLDDSLLHFLHVATRQSSTINIPDYYRKLLIAEIHMRQRQNVLFDTTDMSVLPQKLLEVDTVGQLCSFLALRKSGRIPLPRNAQQLWSQHKYSVMARSPDHYKNIGRMVAEPDETPSMAKLFEWFIQVLKSRPKEGRLRNALQHMWGYIQDEGVSANDDKQQMIHKIQWQSYQKPIPYLLHSTALSEFECWIY